MKHRKSTLQIGVRQVLILLLLWFASNSSFSQDWDSKYQAHLDSIVNTYDQEQLTRLYTEYNDRYTQERIEAETFALLNNIPILRFNEDGTFDELQKLSEDGTPIYYTLYNVDAAISTRANFLNTGGGLGLTLDGDDLTAHV